MDLVPRCARPGHRIALTVLGRCNALLTLLAKGDYPVKDVSRAVPFQVIGVGVVINPAGEVLIDQLDEGLLGGLGNFLEGVGTRGVNQGHHRPGASGGIGY